MQPFSYISVFVFMIFLAVFASNSPLLTSKDRRNIWVFLIVLFLIVEVFQVSIILVRIINYLLLR